MNRHRHRTVGRDKLRSKPEFDGEEHLAVALFTHLDHIGLIEDPLDIRPWNTGNDYD